MRGKGREKVGKNWIFGIKRLKAGLVGKETIDNNFILYSTVRGDGVDDYIRWFCCVCVAVRGTFVQNTSQGEEEREHNKRGERECE